MMPEHGLSRYANQKCRCDICRAAMKAYNKEWRARNDEDSKRKSREWKVAHPESNKRYQEDYWAKHEGDEVLKERYRAYKRNAQLTRIARQREQFVEKIDAVTVYEMHGGRCGICSEFIDGEFHVDHIHPLSRGGLHAYINVQPAHPRCNRRKHAKEVMPQYAHAK